MNTINGIEFSKCSSQDLVRELDAGHYFDSTCGLTPEQERRMTAIEIELANREQRVAVTSGEQTK